MKYYSEFTQEYVRNICDAFNASGLIYGQNSVEELRRFEPEYFDSLTDLIQNYVVKSAQLYEFFNSRGLVNRGRCPYTGELITKYGPKYTFMGSRSVYLSEKGMVLMKKESDEEYEAIMGRPAPQRPVDKKSGCYIATVCYGDENAIEVLRLKKYRDDVLLRNRLGRLFVKIYYYVSPFIANKLKGKSTLNNAIKIRILDRIVRRIN